MDVPAARSAGRQTLAVAEIESLAGYARGASARREVGRIARNRAAGPEYYDDRVDVLFHDGDLEIRGDFRTGVEPWAEMLVVHGDLAVHGLFEDCLDPESVVVVTGDLRAGNVITKGWLEVGGDLAVAGHVLFDDNDCSAEIFGDITAGFVFTKYHHVEAHGRVVAPLIAGDWRRIQSPHDYAFVEETDARLVSMLVPEVLVVEGDPGGEPGEDWDLDYVDSRAMADLLRTGRSPLLTTDPSHAP